MSYSHSRKPDLHVTHSSHLGMWLSVLVFFSLPRLNFTVRAGLWVLLVGGNIAISNALPPLSFVYCIVNIK